MVESSSPPRVCGVGGVIDAVVATVPEYTSTRDDSRIMPLLLPPLSGHLLTTSVFNSPATHWVSSLLKTTLLGSPGFGEWLPGSLGLIVNAELANYNTGSSDDGDYDKGRPPQQQNNSRWQGNDDDDNDNGKTTMTARQQQWQDNDDGKTTTMARQRQWQDNDNGKTTMTTTAIRRPQ
ncbi:hypothetical protein EDB89DRAFT_1913283 [Lactarius sanguifluus]|nr:hypothetical protein EDB89DRAFT_1913283 [Lactarius sanguifluus]